jgi:hypothetical protein
MNQKEKLKDALSSKDEIDELIKGTQKRGSRPRLD